MKKLFLLPMLTSTVFAQAQVLDPYSKKVDVSDNYHGTIVADPYRWLEDDYSNQTKEWVAAQNRVTFGYLDKIPYRTAWLNRLEEIANYPKYTNPSRNNEYYYFYKNDGLQNQSVLYRQKGLTGVPQLVIDPNKFSADGTTSLAGFNLSKNGRYAVVGKSVGGSDWRKLYVMDMRTLTYLPDSVEWVKVSGASWMGDGFFYSRYPTPEKGKELSTKNENHQVFFHKVGTPQSADVLVYEDAKNPQRFHSVNADEDQRYALLNISDRGKGKRGNALWYYDNKTADKTFKPIIAEPGDYNYSVLDITNGIMTVRTNDGAKNERIVAIDMKRPEKANWKTIIAEKPEAIASAGSAGNKIFVTYLKDVTTRAYVYSMTGALEREISLPGLGTAGGFSGKRNDKMVFYTYNSFINPPTTYQYNIATGKSTLFRRPEVKFNPADYVSEQIFYTSKDGTKIPMFISYKKGMLKNGKNPTMLYGYGGFNISLTPGFNSNRIAWMEQSGIFASANLRGGSEYGEKWHEEGMRLKKQNVFDDFIAAAEYLIKENYTSKDFLSIEGRSNGGLLVGAVMNQRPDLFKVALPGVGVMDMLRFQKFTIGWNWIADYGSSDNAEDFKVLYAYSPLHNIKKDVEYPATLIVTADHDDRVVPAHSFKYAATLQESYKGKNPILIRIGTNSGHGASNLRKGLEETADMYAFVFYNMGLVPKF